MGNTTTNNKKKKSNARKIIPAIGMLMTSAAMLTTSTYAWFTMNKEVSITGISLTASVPETLEISLGSIASPPAQNNVSNNDYTISVTDPRPDFDEDWSNTVDIAGYYNPNNSTAINFGQLLPVSSVNGSTMIFTEDAVGDGKSLSSNAVLSPVSSQLVAGKADRYYLDIPVWFRSTAKGTSSDKVNLSVTATIENANTTPGSNDSLYKAARVSILDADGAAATSNPQGVILNSEAQYNSQNGNALSTDKKAFKAGGTIGSNSVTKDSLMESVTIINQTGTSGASTVVSVPKNTGTGRTGADVEKTVRIWLEGEDVSCYNPNAGQSFTVSLVFKDVTAP